MSLAGFYEIAGFGVLLAPFAVMLRQKAALPPISRAHLRWLLLILLASAMWRVLLPVPGYFKEANNARDFALAGVDSSHLNITLPVFKLYRWLLATGLRLRPDRVLFAANMVLAWLTLPLVFFTTILLTRRSRLALLATVFIAFLPAHAKIAASEALTPSTAYIFASLVMLWLLWVERRDIPALLVALALVPLLAATRKEGVLDLAVAAAVASAQGFRLRPSAWARTVPVLWVLGAFALYAADLSPPGAGEVAGVFGPGKILIAAHRFFSPAYNIYLNPSLCTLAGIAGVAAGILAPPATGMRWFRRLALASFVMLFLPYALIDTGVAPLGESRYQVACVVPACWVFAAGAEALLARISSHILTATGWLARMITVRNLVIFTLLNLGLLTGVLRARDYDMPQEQAFLASLAWNPALDDMRVLVRPGLVKRYQDFLSSTSLLVALKRLRGVQVEYREEANLVASELDSGHVYFFEGLYCRFAVKPCAIIKAGLRLQPVASRRIRLNPYLQQSLPEHLTAGSMVDLTLYRVTGTRDQPN